MTVTCCIWLLRSSERNLVPFQQEYQNTSGTCDWKYHISKNRVLRVTFLDPDAWLQWQTVGEWFLLWDVHRESATNPYETTVVLIYVHIIERLLSMTHLHVSEHACLHVDTDTCVCVLLFSVMIWCTLEKMNCYSYSLSQHKSNDNKHFKRTKCSSLLVSFTKWNVSVVVSPQGVALIQHYSARCDKWVVWCFYFIQIYILLWRRDIHWLWFVSR